jgi:uncharacterized protein (DUF305 family)
MGDAAAKARARVDSVRYPYTQADIDFMTGMIHHHAQAIVISKWAESHGASAAVQRLTARIINAQTDEITLMRTWLGDRDAPVPMVDSMGNVTMPGQAPAMPAMPGMDHSAHAGHAMEMPGMLTTAQMDSLRSARGPTFDQRFLTYMIQHHRGAVAMVQTLFSNHGAGQNETIFKFAADVEVDQTTEIRRMLQMLLELDVPAPAH